MDWTDDRLRVGVAIFVLVLVVWTFDGFNATAINDGWRWKYEAQATRLSDLLGNVLERQEGLRVVAAIPYLIGDRLSPDTFVGHQAVLFVTICVRSLLLFCLLRRLLPDRPQFNILVATLFVFYPGDTSYFWLGSSGLHFVATVSVASALCLVIATQQASKRWLIVALALLAGSLWGYPGFVLPLAAFPVLVAVMLKPGRRLLTSFGAVWYSIIGLNLLNRAIWYDRSYDSEVAERDALLAGRAYARLFARLFAGGWTEAVTALDNPQLIVWAIVVALIVGATIRQCHRPPVAQRTGSFRRLYATCAVGLGLVAISFIPYALTIHRFSTRRTHLLAGLGAALCIAGAVEFVGTYARFRASPVIAGGCLVGLCTAYGVVTRNEFVVKSRAQQAVLAQLVDLVPALDEQHVLVIFEYRAPLRGRSVQGLYNDTTTPLRLLYDDDTIAAVSVPSARPVAVSDDGVAMRIFPEDAQLSTWDFDRIIALDVDENLRLHLSASAEAVRLFDGFDADGYDPVQLIGSEVDKDSAACRMFSEDRLRPRVCTA